MNKKKFKDKYSTYFSIYELLDRGIDPLELLIEYPDAYKYIFSTGICGPHCSKKFTPVQ